MKSNLKIGLIGAGLIFGTTCCKVALDKSESRSEALSNAKSYSASGRVIEIFGDGNYLKIRHGRMNAFMEGMEMSFEVRDTLQLGGASAGDSVLFSLRVPPDVYFYIEKPDVVRE